MKEDEFILATNLEEVKFAKYAICEILVGPDRVGLSADDKQKILRILFKAESDIFRAIGVIDE